MRSVCSKKKPGGGLVIIGRMARANVDFEVTNATFFPGFINRHIEFGTAAIKC